MTTDGHSLPPRVRSWFLALFSIVFTAIVFPFAAAFYSPTAIGYVQFPGVLIFAASHAVASHAFSCVRRGHAFPRWSSFWSVLTRAFGRSIPAPTIFYIYDIMREDIA